MHACQRIHLSLQNVLVGIITEKSSPLHKLLKYFIIIGKLFLWNCRSNQILPNIHGFGEKIAAKYETKRRISKKDFFKKKWILLLKLNHFTATKLRFIYCIVHCISFYS